MLSSTISLLAEPLGAALMGLYAVTWPYSRENVDQNALEIMAQSKPNQKKFSEETTQKIEAFIATIGIDPKKVLIIIDDSMDLPCDSAGFRANGSIKYQGYAEVTIGPKMAEEIDKEFSSVHRFAIGHELGHIAHDDTGIGFVKRERMTSIIRLTAYGVTSIALNTLYPLGWVSTHLMSCIAGKIAGFICRNGIKCQQEFEADRFIGVKSRELRDGGLKFFEKLKSELITIREKQIKEVKTRECIAHTSFERCLYRVMTIISAVKISKEGEHRLNFNHPSIRERQMRLLKLEPASS